jgi:F-type H+-transporting ATPase subunit b
MKINWFTFIAQIINFLILVWLLRHFLYKPILNAVDEREKKIAGQLKDAKADKADAKKN